MAADLALAGCDVRLCEHPAFEERFEATLRGGEIELTGIGRNGTARPAMVTTDFARALRDARLVNLSIPVFAHELFFERMIPHLCSDHTVIVWAGDFGSLRLASLMSHRWNGALPVVLEGSTLPYGARLTGPARVDVLLSASGTSRHRDRRVARRS
jgi:opine dehydrogenase